MAIKTFKYFDAGVGFKDQAADNITTNGVIYRNGTKLKAYIENAARELVTTSQAQTLTNKTIDADLNTISNLEVDNLKVGVLDTDLTSASASHDTIPSAKATKDYVDAQVLTKDAASEIAFTPAGTIVATNVQVAVEEVSQDVTDHVSDTTDAHDASAISSVASGNLAATDVQAALNELQSDVDSRVSATELNNHLNDTTDAHDASAISSIASGNLAATDVQTALNELQSDIDLRALTTGGSIIAPARLDMKKDTEVNLSTYALTAANGQLCFSTDTLKTFVVKNSALSAVGGGSGSGINYILTPDADTGSTGWGTYKDAAGVNPVDGTGGTALYTTFGTTTSSPLRGTTSFLITKTANNAQGEGVNYDFTIDASDKGKVLQGSFEYQIASGTFANNDLSVWIYDVTNAALIQPAPYLIKNSTIIEKFGFEFQTAGNSTSYRLIIHCASTSASAYTVKMDNFNVGPQAKLYGSAVTDWIAYTPSSTGFTSTSNVAFRYRREGDTLEVEGTLTGSAGSSSVVCSLPPGLSIDTVKVVIANTTSAAGLAVGDVTQNQGFSGGFMKIVTATGTSTTLVYSANTATSTNALTPVNNNTIFNTGVISVHFRVPIQGWSSSQVMSADADTRVVLAAVTGDAPSATAGNPIICPTITSDTHAGYSTSTGRYTAPVSGYYRVSGYFNGAAADVTFALYKNGVSAVNMGITNAQGVVTFAGLTNASAGDLLDVRPDSTVNVGVAARIYFERISGPSQIMASESVSALYTGAPPTGTLNGTSTITFGTKIKDTHNAYLSGVYIVPVSGCYSVSATVNLSVNGVAGDYTVVAININGTNKYSEVGILVDAHNGTRNTSTHVHSVPLLAGDLVKITAFASAAGSAFDADATVNRISIVRTGNY